MPGQALSQVRLPIFVNISIFTDRHGSGQATIWLQQTQDHITRVQQFHGTHCNTLQDCRKIEARRNVAAYVGHRCDPLRAALRFLIEPRVLDGKLGIALRKLIFIIFWLYAW